MLLVTFPDLVLLTVNLVRTVKDNMECSIWNRGGDEQRAIYGGDRDLEEKALDMAIKEVFAESGGRFRPWAANGRSIRLGEIVLLVDSDTLVPEVSLPYCSPSQSTVDSKHAGLFEGCC